MDSDCDIIIFRYVRTERSDTIERLKRRETMAETREKVSGKYLEYRGWPLVREENTICYGDMNEKCILILEIMSYTDKGLPGKILIQIVDSKDPTKIYRQGDKVGLYEAFNLGVIWLDHECRKDS